MGSFISGMTPQSGKKREEILQFLRSTAQGFGEGMRAMRLGPVAGRPAII
jgi:FKBP-type peptidyl-prolyl cis-trans isomerase